MKRTTYPYYDVLIYNNNSEPYLTERLVQQINNFNNKDKFKMTTLINYQFNLSQIYNCSLQHSDAELFVFCNNDMEVINPDWLDNIVRWFNIMHDMGICMPFHDFIGDPFKITPINILIEHPTIHWFAIYCMLRKIIENIGEFDERFDLYYHDHDVYKSAKRKGYKILWVYNSLVKHYGERTTINHPKSGQYDLDRVYRLLQDKWMLECL